MIFNKQEILNTQALQILGAVEGAPGDYEQHYYLLQNRLLKLYQQAESDEGRDATCNMISEFFGPDGLTECNSMNGAEIVETAILETSAGAALLSDLRQRWSSPASGKTIAEIKKDEFDAVSLRSWLETISAEYLDI